MTTFNLHKMHVLHGNPIQYQLNSITLNTLLNKKLTLEWSGEINCIQCDRKTKTSFQQGFCFPCMQKINECNNCMIHPERCLVETENIKCDSSHWAHQHCHQKQIVYLANSSGLKVGVTQIKNNPSRWIDQGAAQALPIFQTSNRYQAGLIEVALKNYVADKTNWRIMLRENVAPIDLINERNNLLLKAEKDLDPIFKKYDIEQKCGREAACKSLDQIALFNTDTVFTFDYPVLEYPTKIVSLSFDKTPKISGILRGIKGQYLIFDTGVLNSRKFSGYAVTLISFENKRSDHPL
ncbi:MAG: DUF2797 domain-containing protein [Gammaproteobacteria bacterium]|nr:DUF2797 domain-containing protein [Gammaproteobacteria bacterium]